MPADFALCEPRGSEENIWTARTPFPKKRAGDQDLPIPAIFMGCKMPSPIESFLFTDRGVHAVVGFSQMQDSIRVMVAPWERLGEAREAVFHRARITSIDVYADDDDDLNIPWDIIGFECSGKDDGLWGFILHCAGIEYAFEAAWPILSGIEGPVPVS